MGKFNHIEAHKDAINNGSAIVVLWQVYDVLTKAEEMEINITHDQAIEVLQDIASAHDCGNGITWDTLEAGIEAITD